MKQSSLPIPDPTSQSHSRILSACIKDMIEKSGGSIGFDQYMNSVLYQPDLGYYSSNIQKFGFTGDFITAPNISRLFSEMIAVWAISFWEKLNLSENYFMEELGIFDSV